MSVVTIEQQLRTFSGFIPRGRSTYASIRASAVASLAYSRGHCHPGMRHTVVVFQSNLTNGERQSRFSAGTGPIHGFGVLQSPVSGSCDSHRELGCLLPKRAHDASHGHKRRLCAMRAGSQRFLYRFRFGADALRRDHDVRRRMPDYGIRDPHLPLIAAFAGTPVWLSFSFWASSFSAAPEIKTWKVIQISQTSDQRSTALHLCLQNTKI